MSLGAAVVSPPHLCLTKGCFHAQFAGEAAMATVELTNLDERMYAALATRAAQNIRSIGQEAESLLRESLVRPAHSPRKATEAVLKIAGTWQDSRSTEEILEEIQS
jgi:hypothetical protein